MVEPLHLVAVPTTACMSPLTQVIHWAHTSLLSCHPGVKRTMFVISRRFWWPAMEPEVQEYIEARSVCTRNKTSSKACTGLFHPLPIPSRPWSDISLDFVTGLPVTQGNTTVLTVVNHFSKIHRITKITIRQETAEAMMNQIFRVHGFPRDIVSDRGPQFVFRFWKEFCRLIGAKASLTSGYHPEASNWKPASDAWYTRYPKDVQLPTTNLAREYGYQPRI